MLTRTLRRPALLAAPLLVVFSLAAGVFAAPPDFTGLAPARSFFVVSIPNFKAMSEAFRATPLGKLWDEPAMKSFMEEATEDASKSLGEFLKSIDAEAKDFHAPEGQVGLALFFPETKKDDTSGSASNEPYTLVVADVGEHTEDYDKFLEKMIDKAVADKQVTSEHDTYADAQVTIVRPVIDEAAEKKLKERIEKLRRGEDEDEDAEENPPAKQNPMAYWIGGNSKDRRAMRIAHVANTYVVSNDQRAFEDAIDALKGKAIDSFADAPSIHQTLDQHPAGTAATMILVTNRLFDRLFKSDGDSGFGPDSGKLLEAWGVSEVQTVSVGLRLDTPDAMAELSLGVLAPEKKGLLSLISTPIGAFEPPAFVPADAAGVTRASFDFPKLFDTVRAFLATFPEEARRQLAGPVEIARDMTQQGLAQMGPAIHVVNTIEQPLSADSTRTTLAIDLKDQEAVSNTIAGIIAKFPGSVEPQEFEGNQIYKLEAIGEIAAGIGFNQLFLGSEKAVQGAMRLAGHKEGSTLAQSAQFKDDTRSLTPGGIMYSWADIEQELRWEFWSFQNAAKLMEQRLTDAGLEPEQRAEYMKEYKADQPKWIEKLPPVETVLPHVGNTVSELRATPDGFRGRVLMIKPTEKK
jgi:hypothetical protein